MKIVSRRYHWTDLSEINRVVWNILENWSYLKYPWFPSECKDSDEFCWNSV